MTDPPHRRRRSAARVSWAQHCLVIVATGKSDSIIIIRQDRPMRVSLRRSINPKIKILSTAVESCHKSPSVRPIRRDRGSLVPPACRTDPPAHATSLTHPFKRRNYSNMYYTVLVGGFCINLLCATDAPRTRTRTASGSVRAVNNDSIYIAYS